MPKCFKNIPSERIRVFISSAQDAEDGFEWSKIRKRIKDYLSLCPYLNPFIIEDNGSIDPSRQFFQKQIDRADVVVFLIKGVVREGTKLEYYRAIKQGIPFLVFFLQQDDSSLSVAELKEDIINHDRCTYQEISNADYLENDVWDCLMNNVVRSFQDKKENLKDNDQEERSINIPQETISLNADVPSKTILQKFSSCYNYLFKILKIDYSIKNIEDSEYHEFGCSLIKWLITGEWDIADKNIINFLAGCKDIYSDTQWIQKRWDAVKYCSKGNMTKALASEKAALQKAKKAKEPEWLITNILIDCRNFENDINMGKLLPQSNEFQRIISMQACSAFLPVSDRYLTSIYEQINKDRFRIDTASPYTHYLGSGLSTALKNLASYLFTIAIYGSYAHLHETRRILAHILTQYAKINKDNAIAFEGLKQLVLYGDSYNYKNYLNSNWDFLYFSVATKADELWELTDYIPIQSRDRMRKEVISSVGLYMTDKCFSAVEDYIYTQAFTIQSNDSESLFESMLEILDRLNPEKVIDVITIIISEKRYCLGTKLSHIIMRLDLSTVSETTLGKLSVALKEQLPNIINNNGDPQMISALVERSPDLFGFLETMDGNGLEGDQLSLYQINTGSKNWLPVLEDKIASARSQFEANNKDGGFYLFVDNPYSMISRIARKEQNEAIESLLKEKFIPLCVEILNSNVAVPAKEACVACLCDVLNSFNAKQIKIPGDLIDAIKNIDVQKGTDFYISDARRALEMRTLMSKILCGIYDTKELFQWCIDFRNLEKRDRIVLVDCIEKYLYRQRDNIDSLIISIALQCSADDETSVRQRAYRCLAYILSSPQRHPAVVSAFYNGVNDAAQEVRFTLLGICQENILSRNMSRQIIELLCKDANYSVRKYANEQLSSIA